MDITPTAHVKTPEPETETPTRIQPIKPLSFSNGVLKRHHPLHPQHHHNPPVVVTYRECLKNHAASLGGQAVDGCGEFMPSPTSTATDPISLKCAACGCHRNFHRRDQEESVLPLLKTTAAIEYQPHHRHHPPPPPIRLGGHSSSPNSSSPPPISSSYPSAPHMLLALSTGLSVPPLDNNQSIANPNGRKRFRTKFTQDQKERMLEFAERVGWKIQKRDEELIREFCNDIGLDKNVLKVWMHNNKYTSCKRDPANKNNNGNGFATATATGSGSGSGSGNSLETTTTAHYQHHHHENNNNTHQDIIHHHLHNNDSASAHVVAANGSSCS